MKDEAQRQPGPDRDDQQDNGTSAYQPCGCMPMSVSHGYYVHDPHLDEWAQRSGISAEELTRQLSVAFSDGVRIGANLIRSARNRGLRRIDQLLAEREDVIGDMYRRKQAIHMTDECDCLSCYNRRSRTNQR